ncbi:MAG: dephospho-CoA kinase [Polyangiaceae bacterium]
MCTSNLVPVTRVDGARRELAGAGEVVDYAVHMSRLDDEQRADRRLLAGAFGYAEVDLLARTLVDFHERANVDDARAEYGGVDSVLRNVEENFEQTRESIERYLDPVQAQELYAFQRGFLQSQRGLLQQRVAQQRVRDGHGDLRLEHVYFREQGIAIIDCIEFNERFRYADVSADIAFLSMNLAEHRRVDLAERLLARYALLANDFQLYRLVDFYQSYRAHVRAKVASFLALDATRDVATRERADREARSHYLLALSAARRTLEPPCVVAVAGLIGSGKSTVADRLSAELGVPVVVADRLRKALAGVSATTPLHGAAFGDLYSPAASRAVYAALAQGALAVLASGRSVLVDASFRSAAERRALRELSERAGVGFRLVECRCARDLAMRRLAERARSAHVSDGRAAIFDDFAASYEPIVEVPKSEHLVLDTTGELADNVAKVLAWLPLTGLPRD